MSAEPNTSPAQKQSQKFMTDLARLTL
nr:hypothetical protein [Tanacetum cinerariifolium]